MSLIEILDKEIIDLALKGTTKDEVLQEMSELLLDTGYIEDVRQFKNDIYEREKEGITGIGNGIAIPHGKSSVVKKVGIAIGRTSMPIQWESIDEEPVNLVFLFCVSNDVDYARNHLMLLAEIAGKLGNDVRVENMHDAKTADELIATLVS